jgi:tetratricopeptide (TPR) repeat protein
VSQGVGNDPLAQARLLAAQGRAPEAKSLLEAILQEEPTHERALLLLADLLLAAAREAEALAVYRRAASLHEQSAEAHTGLANCLHALHEDDAALEEAQAAHALLGTGDNARHAAAVYLTLVWCLREKRLLREALAAAEEGLARVNDAVLAQWASTVEEELAEAEKERC